MAPSKFASINFKKPTSRDAVEKAYDVRCKPPPNLNKTNIELVKVHDVPLYDMRPILDTLSLDAQGFIATSMPSSMSYDDFFDQDKLQNVFAEEVRSHLLKTLGASCIFFHECVIRKCTRDLKVNNGYGQPATTAHGGMITHPQLRRELTASDYTLDEVSRILETLGGEEVAKQLKIRRFQALNIWKPLKGPVKDWPLALCDLRSVNLKDLVPMDEVYADDTLESYQVHYNENQRWYFLRDQNVSEYLIFKSADSHVQGTVPHVAFRDPDTPKGEPGRESIELRAMVVY